MKAVIYCRVSTDDQEKEGTSLQTQNDACLRYCQERGYEVNHDYLGAESGLTLDRPKLNKMRELVRTGGIDVIVVYCQDRLYRNPNQGVILTEEFEKYGVVLESVTETIENTDLGKMISYVRGYASKLEADKIRERTMRGKYAYLKDGKLPQGTGIGIYGYDWDKESGRRAVNDYESKVVQRIFEMAIKGISTNKIAIILNKEGVKTKSGGLWYPLTVRRILRNLTYTGKTYFGQTKRVGKTKIEIQPQESWILLPDITPPIITDEIFNRAQEAMKLAKESRPVKANAAYLLTGFMKCIKCGSTIGGTTLNGKYRYYKCRGSNPTATRDKICDAGYIKADELETIAWNYIRKLIKYPDLVLQTLESTEKANKDNTLSLIETKINRLKKSLKFYPRRMQECHELLTNDDVEKDYVLDAINTLKAKREKDELELRQLEKSQSQIKLCQQLRIKFTNFSRFLRRSCSKDASLEEKREILKEFQTEILAIPGEYYFKVLTDAEIKTGLNKLIKSKSGDQNLVTIEQTSA